MSAAHQQVAKAAVDEGHMWIKSFIHKTDLQKDGARAKYNFDYRGQYQHVEMLIVCMFNSTSSLFPIAYM